MAMKRRKREGMTALPGTVAKIKEPKIRVPKITTPKVPKASFRGGRVGGGGASRKRKPF